MRQLKFSITTDAGGTGNATHTVSAFVLNAYVVPGSGAASGADITIQAPPEPGIAPRSLLSASNIGTSPVDYPLQIQAKDATGAAISGTYMFAPVCGDLTVTINQGGDTKPYTVYVIVLDSDPNDGRR